MTRIIPRDLIKHLEWSPGQEVPKTTPVKPTPVQQRSSLSIEALVNHGKEFYDRNMPNALRQAQDYATPDGVVASMPYNIAGKALADKSNYLWQHWFTTLTEENVGIDKKGFFVSKGKPVVITLHGGGILTPDRIQQAYDEGLTGQSAAKFTEKEIDDLLDGILPNGERIELYSTDDVKNAKIPYPFGKYGVVTDFETAKATTSGYHRKNAFLENPLVIARAGTLEHLESYYEKAKSSEGNLANYHPFKRINPTQSQGRLLFLSSDYDGLYGNNSLLNSGRFVGVAPEARSARK